MDTRSKTLLVVLLISLTLPVFSQQNRVRYNGAKSPSTNNRVHYTAKRQAETQPVGSPVVVAPPQQVIYLPMEQEQLAEATQGEVNAITGLMYPYTKAGPYKVAKAFYDFMPNLPEFEQLFTEEAVAEKFYHEYFDTYRSNFQTEILGKLQGIDADKTRVYRTKLSDYAPDQWRQEGGLREHDVLRADFYWPDDQFEVLSSTPVISLLFVNISGQYKIFHLAALRGQHLKP